MSAQSSASDADKRRNVYNTRLLGWCLWTAQVAAHAVATLWYIVHIKRVRQARGGKGHLTLDNWCHPASQWLLCLHGGPKTCLYMRISLYVLINARKWHHKFLTRIACKIILLNSLVLIVVYKHWNKHRTLKINPSKCQLVMFGGHNLKYCPVIFLKSCGALTSVITSTPTLCVTRRILAFRVYVRLKLQRETWEWC